MDDPRPADTMRGDPLSLDRPLTIGCDTPPGATTRETPGPMEAAGIMRGGLPERMTRVPGTLAAKDPWVGGMEG